VSNLIIPDFPTDYEIKRSTALHKLVDFFIKRMKGEVGDILLTNDARLEGLIDDYTDEFFTPKENRWKYKEN